MARPASRPQRDEPTFIEQARRDQIVTATVEVLAAHGYRQATIGRIAEAAGISKGLVLYHFAGKDDLMHQTLLRTYERMGAGVLAEIDLEQAPPDILRALVIGTVRNGVGQRIERRALEQIIINLGISATGGDDTTISFAEKEPLYLAYEELFRGGQATGHFRNFDVRVMAVTYQGSIDATFKYLDAHPEVEVETFGADLADLLVAAIRAGAKQGATPSAPSRPGRSTESPGSRRQ